MNNSKDNKKNYEECKWKINYMKESRTDKDNKEVAKFLKATEILLFDEKAQEVLTQIGCKRISFNHNVLGLEFSSGTLSVSWTGIGYSGDRGQDMLYDIKADRQDLTNLQAIKNIGFKKAEHYGKDIYLFMKLYYNLINGRVKNKFDIK